MSQRWRMFALRHTIIGATLQQQSTFIQVTEFPHADEIVVHSRNFPFSGLPSGACKQWHSFRHQIQSNVPFTDEGVGGWGSWKRHCIQHAHRDVMQVQILQGCICVYIMNSQQSWDHRAMNSLPKCENTAAQQSECRASVTDDNDNEQDSNRTLSHWPLCTTAPLFLKDVIKYECSK